MFRDYEVTETEATEKVRKTLQSVFQKDKWYKDSFNFSRKYIYRGMRSNGGQPVEHKLVKALAEALTKEGG